MRTLILTVAAMVLMVTAGTLWTACPGVDVSHAPTVLSDALQAMGWTGDPTDGREALYPRCR